MRRLSDRTRSAGAHRELYEPREPIFQTRPGDFVLLRRDRDVFTDAAALGGWLRGRTSGVWNHAAMVVGVRGELVEATREGVVEGRLSEYADRPREVVTVFDNTQHRRMASEHAVTLLGALDEWEMLAVCAAAVSGRPSKQGRTAAQLVAACLRVCSIDIDPARAMLADLLRL